MSHSDLFKKMAALIEQNEGSTFGGAYVIIPPGQDAKAMEVLVLDTQQDQAQFFMLLHAKVQSALQQIDDQQRKAQMYGR